MAGQGDRAGQIAMLKARRPGAYRLARVLSLAARVEFPLMRRVRLELLPGVDASAEADLCASGMLESVTTQGLSLDPEAAALLRRDLAGDAELFDRAWALVAAVHERAPWTVRAEEHINRCAASPDPHARERIEPLIMATAREMAEGTDRVGASRWLMRMLARLPAEATATQAARAVQAGVAANLGGAFAIARDHDLPPDAFENWFPWLLGRGAKPRPISVTLLDGWLEISADPASIDGVVQIPETMPLIVDVRWHDGASSRAERVSFAPGERTRIRVAADQLELRGLDGRRWRLRVNGAAGASRGGLDFTAIRARHRPFLGREQEVGDLTAWIAAGRRELWTSGPEGIGKTALLCRLLDMLEERGERVLYHCADGGGDLHNPAVIEASLLQQMAAWGSRGTGTGRERTLLSEIDRHAGSGPVFVLLDALDTVPSEQQTRLAEWFASLVVGTPRDVRIARTSGRIPTTIEPDEIDRIELDERRESNVALCRASLNLHRDLVDRAAYKPQPRVHLVGGGAEAREVVEALDRIQAEVEADLRRADVIVFAITASLVQAPGFAPALAFADTHGVWTVPVCFDRAALAQLPLFANRRGLVYADSPSTPWRPAFNEAMRVAVEQATPASVLLRRADGHIGHLAAMLEWLGVQTATPVDIDRLPPTLYGAFDAVWEHIREVGREEDLDNLGALLAAARERVALSVYHDLVGGDRRYDREIDEALTAMASAAMVAMAGEGAGATVDVTHPTVRAALARHYRDEELREANAAFADVSEQSAPGYALRHGLYHLVEAGRVDEAHAKAGDIEFLTRVCAELGVENLEQQLVLAAAPRPVVR